MAIFQLGSIVTNIKGSIGGTSFKKQRGTNVMYRKSNGFSKSRQLLNQALVYSRWIFTNWPFLSVEDKEAWGALAGTITFPDKFGNLVHITGRQLYTKVNINLQGIEYYSAVPEGFNTLVPLVSISNAIIDPATNTASLQAVVQTDQECYILVSAQVSVNPLSQPIFIRRKTLIQQLSSGTVTLDFGASFFAQFPYVSTAYNVRYYIELVNVYGIKGTPLWIDAVMGTPVYTFSINQAVQSSDGSVSLNTTNSWGGNPAIRVWGQPAVTGTPSPDFGEAVLVGDFTVFSEHFTQLGFVLFASPWLLDVDKNMVLWISLQDPNGDWLANQSIVLEGDFSQPSNYVTNAALTVFYAVDPQNDYIIFNDPLAVDYTDSTSSTLAVQFSNWETGDPLPDPTEIILISSVFGSIKATDMFEDNGWIAGAKVYAFENIVAGHDVDQTLEIPIQVVPVIP